MYNKKILEHFWDLDSFPPIDPYYHGVKYVEIAQQQKLGKVKQPSRIEMEKLLCDFRDCHENLSTAELDVWRSKIVSKLGRNRSLFQFTLDQGGLKSDFFLPWIMNVPQAITLEAAFGYGYDLYGTFRKIPEDDPFYWWVIREPMFAYLRQRAEWTAGIIRNRERVLFLGAGYLPELRYTRYTPTKQQLIEAYDINQTIDVGMILDEVPAGCRIKYKKRAMENLFGNPHYQHEFDAVVMNGVMSYQLNDMSTIIKQTTDLLGRGGVFIFDLQLEHWNLARDAMALGWVTNPPMQLLPNEGAAYKKVVEVIRPLRNVLHSNPVTFSDSLNLMSGSPTGVGFVVEVR